MGEGTAQLSQPRVIEREIEVLRMRLDRSVAELIRRRRELTDVRLQLHRHPGLFVAAGTLLALAAAGVVLMVRRGRERQRPLARAHRLRLALDRAIDKPQRVATDPPLWQKIAASAATALAISVGKKALDRAWPTQKIRKIRGHDTDLPTPRRAS